MSVGAGTEKIEAQSFRLNDDFHIKYGKELKPLMVPRLSFKTGEVVIAAISKSMSADTSMALKVIGLSYEQKENPSEKKMYDRISTTIGELIKTIVNHKLYGLVQELLVKVSEGTITKEIIDEMQFSEATGLLQFLLEENLRPLKNLYASLEAITTSAK